MSAARRTDSRVLAKRHFWLSWWGGLLLVWAGCAVLALLASSGLDPAHLLQIFSHDLLVGYLLVAAVTTVFLGLPALAGGLLRWPLLQRLFARATSTVGLLLRTALLFEASAAFCWLLWEIYTWFYSPLSFQILPKQHFLTTTLAFFGLSLPWLVSSVVAAWWLWRPERAARAAAVSNTETTVL